MAILIIISTLCIVPTFAENDVMDYLDISQEVMIALKKQDDTKYIKTYGSCGLEYLHKTTVKEITEKHDYQEYYISIKYGMPYDRYLYGDNWAFKKQLSSLTKSFLKKCLDFDSIESSISGNAKITNCYIFDDTVNHGGLYCYYETTKGNYILFRQVIEEVEPLYLVSEEKFRDISKKYDEIIKENSGKYMGSIDITEYINMSKYKYNPCRRIIIISLVVLAVVAVVIVAIILLNKKRKLKKVK